MYVFGMLTFQPITTACSISETYVLVSVYINVKFCIQNHLSVQHEYIIHVITNFCAQKMAVFRKFISAMWD